MNRPVAGVVDRGRRDRNRGIITNIRIRVDDRDTDPEEISDVKGDVALQNNMQIGEGVSVHVGPHMGLGGRPGAGMGHPHAVRRRRRAAPRKVGRAQELPQIELVDAVNEIDDQIGAGRVIGRQVDEGVNACSAGEGIGAESAGNRVIAAATQNRVAAVIAIERVVVGTTVDIVLAVTAVDRVVAGFAVERVRAIVAAVGAADAVTPDRVVSGPSVNKIAAVAGADRVIAATGPNLVVAIAGRNRVGVVGGVGERTLFLAVSIERA